MGFEKVKSKGDELKDYIDPENGFLYRLKLHGIINKKEFDDLKNITPYQSLNERLIIAIEKKIKSQSEQFIKALCEDEQDHIAKFIVTAGCSTDSDERLLPREFRKVIDKNMFCLKVLIDTERQDLLMKLVAANCIREIHRDRVMNFKPDEERAYQLLIIIQRRRFKDFFNFMECLRKTMQTNIVKVLEKGRVSEIKVQLLKNRHDERNIAAELVRKLTGCIIDEGNESNLSEDQKKIVNEILAELKENDIHFVGTCAVPSNSDSLPMFFQSKAKNSFLKNGCESGTLKNTLEKLFRTLLPEREPPLVKEATMGQQSDNHHLNTEQNSGECSK